MKLLITRVLVIVWTFAVVEILAQDNGETGDSGSTEERICIPVEEAEQSAGEESGPSEEGTGEEEESALPVCDEDTPGDAAPEDVSADEEPASEDAGSEEEEAISSEIDPSQEFEVDPEDEISEDFPVPLPSDI